MKGRNFLRGYLIVSLVAIVAVLGLLSCEPEEAQVNRSVSMMVGPDSDQFAQVVSGYQFEFPRDHLPHPEFRTEWWYLTANLKAEDGEEFGFQWTLFRSRSLSGEGHGWENPQRYMAHLVVTGEDKVWSAERFARGGIGQAGVLGQPFRAWLDNWEWRSFSDSPFPGVLSFADDSGMAGKLAIQQTGNIVLQGEQGYSKKHATKDIASYYFSAPFLQIDGRIELDGQRFEVTGEAWFDREWSSRGLADNQLGWDWFAIHLDDGSALMLYQIREKDTRPYYFGSLSWADGRIDVLEAEDIQLLPVTFSTQGGKTHPVAWQIDVPSKGIKLKVDVVRKEQWLPFIFSYWEGPIRVTGSHTGQGFMELTGY
ncbi:ABC transporter [Photobacterium gaetbulicola]|uniref:ABC transporter n=1 Tax=Photobacterium gaetbulicola TaxID=1295392 RepID=A0A0B9GE44_9GAMM|nr:lipocalin-like domain-containing protein [Photobacterium gaetbulicola]KHT63085.1 ABC transporter [Photobacterium gaetbulicola]